MRVLVLVAAVVLSPAACRTTPAMPEDAASAELVFSGTRAYADLVSQVEMGPRYPGSPTADVVRNWIEARLQTAGWAVERHAFRLPDDTPGVNLIARKDDGPVRLLLGTHYDTRPVADEDPDPARRDEPVPGAHDGASGVAVLLELARVLPLTATTGVCLALFDAEDSGNVGALDWSLGARAFAGSEHACAAPAGVVIVDMVGDRELGIYQDAAVDDRLQQAIWSGAAQLGVKAFHARKKYAIIDDHVPFRERGIDTAVLIDFDYPSWHTTADTVDKTSADSLAAVGRVLERWLRDGAAW